MFAHRLLLVIVVLAALAAVTLSAARPTSGASGETRYVVKPGDTLWALAASRYDCDPREAIWRIRQRNRLGTSTLAPGMVLALPP
jgi:LysM domain